MTAAQARQLHPGDTIYYCGHPWEFRGLDATEPGSPTRLLAAYRGPQSVAGSETRASLPASACDPPDTPRAPLA